MSRELLLKFVQQKAPQLLVKTAKEEHFDSFDEYFEKVAKECEMLRKRIREGTKSVEAPKSKEQAEAGNYKKGHFSWKGLKIAVENPVGSIRKGHDSKGKAWRRTMRHDYGYIKRTESEADGDHIDVFFGPDPDSEIVFVVDQCRPAKEGRPFDEHKVMCGFKSKNLAKEAYLSNYATGWKGMMDITPLTLDQFKWWIKEGDTGTPLSQQDWHKA